MSRIRISTNVSQEDVINVQKQFLLRGRWTSDQEIYYSPDGHNSLELRIKGERPFGPRVFTASVISRDGDRFNLSQYFNLSRRQVFSSYCYGRGYDHWAGDPWRPDSRMIAFFQGDISKQRANVKAGFFDVAQTKCIEIIDSQEMISHHMWSPSGNYYLYRSLDAWYLVDVNSLAIRLVGKVARNYPKHCYLVSDDWILYLEGSCKVISTKSLDIVWEEPIPDDVGSGAYSLLDPISRRVFVGVEASLIVPSLSEFVTSSNWYAFEVM